MKNKLIKLKPEEISLASEIAEFGKIYHFVDRECPCFANYLKKKRITVEELIMTYNAKTLVRLYTQWELNYNFSECEMSKEYKLLKSTLILWARKRDPSRSETNNTTMNIKEPLVKYVLKNESNKKLNDS